MLATLLLAALGAAPVDVVTFIEPDAYAFRKFKKTNPGRTVIDAGALYALLLAMPEGLPPIRDFDKFTAPPPPGWPRTLDEVWKESLSQCRERVGDDWKSSAAQGAALACGERLGRFLWQRYVAELHASRVVIFGASTDAKKNQSTVGIVSSTPEGATETAIDESGTVSQLHALEDEALNDLAAAKGATRPHEVLRALFEASADDPFARYGEVTDAVPLKKSCDQLPGRLEISPASKVAASVAARWASSAKGAAPTLRCTLSFDKHQETGGLMPLTVVAGTLHCGSIVFAIEASQEKVGPRSPVDLMSARLIDGLAAKLCP